MRFSVYSTSRRLIQLCDSTRSSSSRDLASASILQFFRLSIDFSQTPTPLFLGARDIKARRKRQPSPAQARDIRLPVREGRLTPHKSKVLISVKHYYYILVSARPRKHIIVWLLSLLLSYYSSRSHNYLVPFHPTS